MSRAKPACISGTWHNDGQAIHDHIRREQAKAILAAPSQIRRKRTPGQWKAMYKAAMAEKKL